MRRRQVIGCMTGTSCDAVDVALATITGTGLQLRASFAGGRSARLGELGDQLRAFAAGEPMSAAAIAAMTQRFMAAHAAVIGDWAERADLLVLHGQTVLHRPPLTWQLADGAWLATRLQLPTIWNLRSADCAAGGQGAPITPLADLLLVGSDHERAVVNLGGFCNITWLPADGDPTQVRGGDVCSCCQLLDGLARTLLDRPCDEDGAIAASGVVDPTCQARVVELLAAQVAAGRSLGSGDEAVAEVGRLGTGLAPADLLATVCAAQGAVIAAAIGPRPAWLAGGGLRHPVLRAAIVRAATGPIADLDELGFPAAWREAVAMAVLGALAADGVPVTLPAITGLEGPAPLAGTWAFPAGRTSAAVTLPAVRDEEAPDLPPDRSAVLSEQRHPLTADLHRVTVAACVERLQQVDDEVQPALQAAAGDLVALLEAATPGFCRGGRLIYVGAGTSGRLGVLDASEAPPTFQVPPGRVVGLIAGGDAALRRSSEGLEDDPDGAVPALRELGLGPDDTLIGIAAGGTTPYPRGAVTWAAAQPRAPVTGFLSCSPCTAPPGCRHLVVVATGPEAITGSTRMKAGTATKMALNLISTTLMVQEGRVFENLMVDVTASNAKLRDRAARIISTLTGRDRQGAFALLAAAGGSVKLAIAMDRLGLDAPAAAVALAAAKGRLADLPLPPG